MKVAILGGSGFIGQHLCQHLLDEGHEVQVWTREPQDLDISGVQAVKWPLDEAKKHLDVDAIVNLAGETINQRWTPEAKERILHSRVDTTYHIIELIKRKKIAPKVLVNGSAIGYYGTSHSKTFTEEDGSQSDFLSQVSTAWEKAAEQVTMLGVRLVKLRLGLVLSQKGGALSKMMLPMKLYVGGNVGTGRQWVSWVHIQDVVRIMALTVEDETVEGVWNVTAPKPVRMKELTQTLAKALNKPHWLPVPSFMLQLLLGEMSDLILKGQKVLPAKLQAKGYTFKYPDLQSALLSVESPKHSQQNDPKDINDHENE
ncbi:TIGR01777 family oxidoreductase [Caldalkalibacillus salinus]|uniref:TIGR01777 family oxidoreductase n=1 Tax=Caldalkalibacillus salinus TaxID=2803787 RepID=UPI001921D080|nr:TIGR01777 family oxidoreductase [Caldalkalibacillus salinus]